MSVVSKLLQRVNEPACRNVGDPTKGGRRSQVNSQRSQCSSQRYRAAGRPAVSAIVSVMGSMAFLNEVIRVLGNH